jgi:hypothetical protein
MHDGARIAALEVLRVLPGLIGLGARLSGKSDPALGDWGLTG